MIKTMQRLEQLSDLICKIQDDVKDESTYDILESIDTEILNIMTEALMNHPELRDVNLASEA